MNELHQPHKQHPSDKIIIRNIKMFFRLGNSELESTRSLRLIRNTVLLAIKHYKYATLLNTIDETRNIANAKHHNITTAYICKYGVYRRQELFALLYGSVRTNNAVGRAAKYPLAEKNCYKVVLAFLTKK